MKKLVCLLAVLAFAAPVMADPCNIIEITGEDAGNGRLRISYEVDAGSPDTLVGIALLVGCDQNATVDPCDPFTVVSTDPCLPVYMDYAHDQIPDGWDPCMYDPCNPPYEIGDGNPIADPDGAGLLGTEGSDFVICMAQVVDPCTTIPKGVVRELAVIQLKDGGAGTTEVTITAEVALRGGAVGSVFGTINVPAGTITVAFGAPECWDILECGGQPQGDFTCDGSVNLADLAAIRDAWGTGYLTHTLGTNHGEYNCCADSNHDGLINLTDLGDIRTGWGTGGHTPATTAQYCAPPYGP